MGVFAYKENSSDIYLENKKFTKYQSENYWAGEGTSYYWPFQGSLDFYVYAPYDADFSCDRATHKIKRNAFTNSDYGVGNSYSGTADGSSSFYNYNCPDLMYGSTIFTYEKINQALNVSLKHALALVQVNAKATNTSVVKIKSMKLEDTPTKANLTVAYVGTPVAVSPTWTDWQEQNLDLTIYDNSQDPKSITETFEQLGNEVLVIPGKPQTSFTIDYTLGNSETVFTAELQLSNTGTPIWKPGKKYVYNITFGVEEIKFAPEVVDWETGGITAGENGGVSVEAVSEQP